jgi:hypothetical protein
LGKNSNTQKANSFRNLRMNSELNPSGEIPKKSKTMNNKRGQSEGEIIIVVGLQYLAAFPFL